MADTRPSPGADAKAKARSAGYAAGSEGWSGDEDAAEPVVSAARNAAQDAGDPPSRQIPRQTSGDTQSDYSLSQPSADDSDDGRFDVAEEQNFDQQSDAARHVGQMSLDLGIEEEGNEAPDEASSKRRKAELKKSLDRSVPPSS